MNNKGFTLLYAVVVTSILLASTLSIISISLRELALTTSSRESQFAFYVANTGMECGQYWDVAGAAETTVIEGPPEVTSVTAGKVFSSPEAGGTPSYEGDFPITCLGNDIRGSVAGGDTYHYANTNATGIYIDESWEITEAATIATTKFRISFTGTADGACADVTVTKEDNGGTISTTIESRGYNTCSVSKRRVERGVQITY